MDKLNRSPRPAQSEWSALIANGLILWRLSTAGQSDLWCLVFEHPDGFCFVLDDDPEGTQPYLRCEHRADVVALVDRADMLKSALLDHGWVDVDVE